MTQRSIHNNTNVPLKPFGIFTGQWEPTSTYLEMSVYVNSTAYLAIGIQQSQDANTVAINTTYNYTPTDDVTVFNVSVGLPFYRIIITNEANVQVAHMAITTILSAVPNTVDANIQGAVTVTGSVVASNLITETLATRRVDFLVVGNWYRVASVGVTTGAQWNAIGAIVDGESVPVIGRLFKCLAIGPAVAGGGTCYDVEYTTDVNCNVVFPATQPVSIAQDLSCNILNFPATQAVTGTISLTDPTSVRVRDAYGDPITTTAGNLNVNLNAISTATALHTIVDSGPATQAVTGTVSLTDPTSVRIRDAYGDPILTTAGNLMVGISNIYTANPLHTIVDSGSVTATPPSSSTITFLGASITGQTIKASAGVLKGLFINSNGISLTGYVKIYNVAVPTSADTPVMVISVPFGSSQTIDTFSLGLSTAIGVRATDGSANNDNVAPFNIINVTAFFV